MQDNKFEARKETEKLNEAYMAMTFFFRAGGLGFISILLPHFVHWTLSPGSTSTSAPHMAQT